MILRITTVMLSKFSLNRLRRSMNLTEILNRIQSRQTHHQIHLEAEVDRIIFPAFVLTFIHTLSNLIFGKVWINFYWSIGPITLGTLIWSIAINWYLSRFFHIIYLIYGRYYYNWISGCYFPFAVIELFIVWDKPWFTFIGIPMTSNTLIFFGFVSRYVKKWNLKN